MKKNNNPAQQNEPLLPAVAYLRDVTGEKGADAEKNLKEQRRYIQKQAKSLGATIVREFVDSGNDKTYPNLQRLLDYISENKVAHVFISHVGESGQHDLDYARIAEAFQQTSKDPIISSIEKL